MDGAIGFTAQYRNTDHQLETAQLALERALFHFPDMRTMTFELGSTKLTLWGRDNLEDSIYRLSNGSLMVLIGSPVEDLSWKAIEDSIRGNQKPSAYHFPCNGRFVLVYISADGSEWVFWNDWLGAIPVYYWNQNHSRIASTLEPIVVSAAKLSSRDFFLPGIVLLLIHGNLIGDWTIYKDMKVFPPDTIVTWNEDTWNCQPCHTVNATQDRWEMGWDDMVEELHEQSKKAILGVLKSKSSWILPLSSGLDSRLISAIGSEAGVDMLAFTWGPPTTKDGFYGSKIAQSLGIPNYQVNLGTNYLAEYVKIWASLFGSALHFHGMYQMPFLDSIKNTNISASIVTGFAGDPLAGAFVKYSEYTDSKTGYVYSILPDGYLHWDIESVRRLLKFSIEEFLQQIADEFDVQKNAIDGALFQKLSFINLWGRQRRFISFQSILSDYWRGSASPYMHHDYARFWMSLPRCALDNRRLQVDMMRRFYPKVMCIPGTYGNEPAIMTGRYLLKRKIANTLPDQIASLLFPEFFTIRNIQTDVLSLKAGGEQAIWPISEVKNLLIDWINMDEIETTLSSAKSGSLRSVRKLQSIQALAFRLHD